MPRSEEEDIVFAIQTLLFRFRQEAKIGGSPVDVDKRILLELDEIPDSRTKDIASPQKEQQEDLSIGRYPLSLKNYPLVLSEQCRVF